MFKKYINFNKGFSHQAGFTLVEAVTVIAVLAVTTAILLVNNRTNELQLSLNTDIAGIANAIGRAKALTLQGVGAPTICGYGVTFAQGQNSNPDTYTIYPYTDCVNWVKGSALAGQGGINNLSSGLRILNITTSDTPNQFIRDVIFYSSDAKVKLFNFDNKSICESGCDVTSSAGIIVINTESAPTSFTTLKIATTGQVTSKSGAYSSASNFNIGSSMILTSGSTGFTYSGDTIPTDTSIVNEGITFNEDTCIPNCFCALNLASGQTCPDGCGGICYAGNPVPPGPPVPPCRPLATDCPAPNTDCTKLDSCGVCCAPCEAGYACNSDTKKCEACSCDDQNGTVDTCGKCSGVCSSSTCKGCAASGTGYTCTLSNNVWSCTVGSTGDLKLTNIYPDIGFK